MSFKSSLSNLYVNNEPLLISSTSGNGYIPIFSENGSIINSNVKIDQISSGASATNGLAKVGNTIKLGSDIIENTDIFVKNHNIFSISSTSGYGFDGDGYGRFTVFRDSISLSAYRYDELNYSDIHVSTVEASMSFQDYESGNIHTFLLNQDGMYVSNTYGSSSGIVILKNQDSGGNTNYQYLPNKSGILALTSDIPFSTSGAGLSISDNVINLDLSNYTTNDTLNINTSSDFYQSASGEIYLSGDGGNKYLDLYSGNASIGSDTLVNIGAGGDVNITAQGNIRLQSGSLNGALIKTTNLSQDRTYQMPNKSGVVALTSDLNAYTNITASALQTLISTNSVNIGTKYLVTNPQDGGQIAVEGNSTSGVNPIATWYYTSNHKAFGLFRLSAGSTGAVTVLTVNGTSIISSSIAYSTSLTQTVTNVVANINGYASTSGYRAYAVNDVCVIEYQTATTAINGATVAVTTTGTLTASNISSMRRGINPTLYRFSIIYNAVNDRVLQCQDDNVNLMKCSLININSYGYNPITKFRWNDPAFKRNTFDDVNFLPCFVEDTSFGFSANYFDKDAQCQYIIALNSSYIYGNKIGAGGTFINNYSLSTGNISYNVCVNQTFFSGNPKYGIANNSIISTQGIMSNTILSHGCYIANNLLATGTARITFNSLVGDASTIYNNQLLSTASAITSNALNGVGSNINSNTLNNSNAYVRFNTLSGYLNAISSNSITGNTAEITFNVLSGANSTINSNTISTGSSFIRGNSLQGNTTTMNSNILNQTATLMENNVLSANSASISSWTPTSVGKVYSNINWASNNKISLYGNSATITGGANLGQNNSPIFIGYIPSNKAYPTFVTFEGNGLSSSSGVTISVNVATDTTVTLTPSLTMANANTINTIASFTGNKTTATHRMIQAVPIGTMTAGGSFQVYADFQISRY